MSVIKLLERNIMKLSAEALVHELCHVRNALNVQFELYGKADENLGEYETMLHEEACRRYVMLYGGTCYDRTRLD